MKGVDLVIPALRDPGSMLRLTPAAWDTLIRQARRAELLGRLAGLARQAGLTSQVPPGPRAHFEAAESLVSAQQLEVRREIDRIAAALAPLGLSALLLKGAAYLAAGEPAALGRTFSDIDILVPKARIGEVESHLMMAGWATTHHSAYDQRYYRQWMHEIPPMVHAARGSAVDVHHAILPLTARHRPASDRLFEAARPTGGIWLAPCPSDLILHSISHLTHNDELSHGLRDLSDIDLMLRRHGSDPGFWPLLLQRARVLDLGRPLHYGLLAVRRILGTPVPDDVVQTARRHAAAAPVDRLMHVLWQQAIRSPHPTASGPWRGLAQFLLYIRAHWLRMPPILLAMHLSVKAWSRIRATDAPT